MRRLSFLFLFIGILFSACSKASTPSGADEGGIDSLDPKDYPTILTTSHPSVFIKDGKLQGYIPYPIAKIDKNNYYIEYYFYDPSDTSFTMYAAEDILSVNNTSFDKYNFNNPLLRQALNVTNYILSGMDKSSFCMNYTVVQVSDDDDKSKKTLSSYTYYQQESSTSFKKIGYKIEEHESGTTTTTESNGIDCNGNSL